MRPLLIALGVSFAGASGGMFSFLGATAGHAFGFGIGVTIMFRGFVRTSSGSRRRPAVVVYTRSGCGLCRAAEQLAATEAKGAHVTLVDIDADDALALAYNIRVPVITVDGIEVAEGLIAAGEIAAAVRGARRSTPVST